MHACLTCIKTTNMRAPHLGHHGIKQTNQYNIDQVNRMCVFTHVLHMSDIRIVLRRTADIVDNEL